MNNMRNENMKILWNAYDILRGSLNPADSKKYILNLFFLKCITIEELALIIPEKASYNYIFENRESKKLGSIINDSIETLETTNPLLKDAFLEADFNSKEITIKDNFILSNLVETFNKIDLSIDNPVEVFELLLTKKFKSSRKSSGEHFTPIEISVLLAKLIEPKRCDSIYDPCAGTGTLLNKVAKEIKEKDFKLYAQEINKNILAICKMNLILNGMAPNIEKVELGNTLLEPKILDGNELKKFNVVVSNFPISLSNWFLKKGNKEDPYDRFEYGIPPKNSGDYAFISHILKSLDEKDGRAAVIVSHGVLFRGRSEKTIRKGIIEDNLIDAVIGLPEDLLHNTSIPIAILIFKKD
ncbi:MAG: N-6 DNA methylase, partial [Candidatus Woesearchaeota archaeon]